MCYLEVLVVRPLGCPVEFFFGAQRQEMLEAGSSRVSSATRMTRVLDGLRLVECQGRRRKLPYGKNGG